MPALDSRDLKRRKIPLDAKDLNFDDKTLRISTINFVQMIAQKKIFRGSRRNYEQTTIEIRLLDLSFAYERVVATTIVPESVDARDFRRAERVF